MKVKKSNFLIRVELDSKICYYNSLTNALVELASNEYEKKMLEEIQKLDDCNIETDNKYVKLGFLVNQQLDEEKIIEYNYQRSKFDNKLLTLDLFPTYLCNLNCEFCFLKKKWKLGEKDNSKSVMEYYESINILINNSTSKRVLVTIYGGEPFIFYNEMITFLKSLNKEKFIEVKIITNGTLIGKVNIKELNQFPFIKSIQISFDGLPEYHDKVKEMMGSFYSSINGINSLVENNYQGGIIIRVNISENNKESISELLTLLKSQLKDKSKIYFYPALINNSNNVVDNNYCVAPEGSRLFKAIFYKTCRLLDLKYIIKLTPLLINCPYLRNNSFCVSPDLRIYKCDNELNYNSNSIGIIKDGKIRLNDFTSYGRVKNFNKIATSLLTKKKCNNCSWLPICRGGCPLEKNKGNCKKVMEDKLKNYIKYGNVRKKYNQNAT